MHNQKLVQVVEAKYLCVLLHKKLSWKSHVNSITKNANQIRGFLQRNIRTCHLDVKAQCYQIYIRPAVEYHHQFGTPSEKIIPILDSNWKWCKDNVHDLYAMETYH